MNSAFGMTDERKWIQAILIGFLVFSLGACEDSGVPVTGGPPRLPTPVFPPIDQHPRWSPDGSRILYYHMRDPGGLWIVNTDGTNPHFVLQGSNLYGDWSPDGSWIVFSQGAQIYKAPFSNDGIAPSTILQLTTEGRNFFPAGSPDGQWIVYDSNIETITGMSFVWKMKFDGSQKQRIGYEPTQGETRMPHWSPTGFGIAHIRYLTGTFSSEIFCMDNNGMNPVRLTFNSATDYYPRYSPDGTKVAFQSQATDDVPQVWVMNTNGSNLRQLTTEGGESPDWSPDNRRIVYVRYDYRRNTSQNGTIWIMNADGSNKSQLTFGSSP